MPGLGPMWRKKKTPALACWALLPRGEHAALGVNRRGSLARLNEEKQKVSAVGSRCEIPGFWGGLARVA